MKSIQHSAYIPILLVFTFMSNLVFAQESHNYVGKKIKENFYLISTGTPSEQTQVGVIIGESGILLIDSWVEGQGEHLLKAIKKISDKPIMYVLNTHSHSDHTGGNKFFADLGATIISQENAMYTNAYGQFYFKDSINLIMGEEKIRAFHLVSHTFDSVIIHLSNSNALFMGDNLATHGYLSVGERGLAGQLEVLDLAISLSDEETVIIPSHAAADDQGSTTIGKKNLISYKNKNIDIIAHLKTLHQQGKPLSEIKRDKNIKELTRRFIVGNPTDKAVERSIEWWLEKGIELELNSKRKLNSNELNLYVGSYRKGEAELEIFQQDGKLFIRSLGRLMAQIVKIGEHHFDLKGFFFEKNTESLKFEVTALGTVKNLALVLGENSHKGEGINVLYEKV